MMGQTDKPNTRFGNELDSTVHIRWSDAENARIGAHWASFAIFFPSSSDAEAVMECLKRRFWDEEIMTDQTKKKKI